jgi:hypothetical protein
MRKRAYRSPPREDKPQETLKRGATPPTREVWKFRLGRFELGEFGLGRFELGEFELGKTNIELGERTSELGDRLVA